MMLPRLIGTLSQAVLVATPVLLAAHPVAACVLIGTEFHQSDPRLQRLDNRPPSAPLVTSVRAVRRVGTSCDGLACVDNSCGDTATVSIAVAAARDDQTPAGALGYRLELVDGVLPPSLKSLIGVDLLAAGATLLLRPEFEEAPLLDASLRLVAIDAAGNESRPSEPFRVRFDGCALAAVGDGCDPEPEAVGESGPEALSSWATAGEAAGCGLALTRSRGSLSWAALVSASLLGALVLRRGRFRQQRAQ